MPGVNVVVCILQTAVMDLGRAHSASRCFCLQLPYTLLPWVISMRGARALRNVLPDVDCT